MEVKSKDSGSCVQCATTENETTDSLPQDRMKDNPTVSAARMTGVKKPQALSRNTYPPSFNYLLVFQRFFGTNDPVDRQLPVNHVRTIIRITTARRTGQ